MMGGGLLATKARDVGRDEVEREPLAALRLPWGRANAS